MNSINRLKSILLLAVTLAIGQLSAQVVVDFESDDQIVCPGVPVEFTDLSTYPGGSDVSWSWEFPSGFASSLTDPAPTVYYYTPGTYTVTLELTVDGSAYTEVKTAYITIVEPSSADFTFDIPDTCNTLTVEFTSTSTAGSGLVEDYLWDFGDGSFSTDENPTHTFTESGTYYVLLFITDENGCSDNITDTVVVESPMTSYISDADGAFSCGSSIVLVISATTTGGAAPYSYEWDYGNGTTTTDASGIGSYADCGSYDVTYTVTDDNGCSVSNTYEDYVTIQCYDASFAMSEDSICEGGSIDFTNLSDPGAESYFWQFNFPASGVSVTSYEENPSFEYSVAGEKIIKLTVTYPDGCTAAYFDTIFVSDGPLIGGIAALDSTACEVPFETVVWALDIEGAGPFTYEWDVEGDLYYDSIIYPSFDMTGNYDFDLYVTDALGCTSDYSYNSFVQIKKPTAEFTVDPEFGCVPLDVTFSNLSTSAVVPLEYFVWDFDDGTTDTTYTLDAFEHVFTEAGNYNVELTVYTEDGCPKSTSLWIQVGDHVAYFEFTDPGSPICNPVGLDNLSEGSEYTTVSWGDGATSTLTPPESDTVHFYPIIDTSTFIVTLTAENNGCISTWTDTVTVLPIPPLYTIAWDCDNPNVGIISINSTLMSGLDFCWDIAGSGDTLCDQTDIIWEFDSLGTYLVQIIADDTISDGGCLIATNPFFYVTVPENVASFSMSEAPLCESGTVTFTSTTSALYPLSLAWEIGPGLYYGDGMSTGMGTMSEVSFDFTIPDIYPITLTSVDSIGCEATYTDTLTYSGVTALFDIDSIVGCETRTIWLEDLSTVIDPTGGFIFIEEYEWNFDDTIACPTYYGPTPPPCTLPADVYEFSLTVTDNFGCSDTYTMILDLTTAVSASFDSDSLSCSSTDTLVYLNTSSGTVLDTFWDFGDGATSTDYDGHHIYSSAGTYTVTLTVGDSLGCTDTYSEDINVIFSDLNADFELEYLTGAACPPIPISLTNTSTGDITDFEWYVERESGYFTYFTDEVLLTYSEPGEYDVTLYIYNTVGCVDSLYLPNVINVPGPTGSLDFIADTICTPSEVSFTVIDLDADLAYIDFGDGDTTLITGDVTYSYEEEGVFCPTIILIDSTGCSFSAVCDSSVFAYNPHILDFGFSDSSYCITDSLLMVNFSSGSDLNPINSYTIDWGDGTDAIVLSDFDSLWHEYSTPGIYTISITSESSVGCDGTYIYELDVPETPPVAINYTPASGCFELEVLFELDGLTTGSAIIEYGDGIVDTVSGDTSHIYTEVGEFYPFVTLVNGACTVDYYGTDPVTVYYPSYAGIELDDSVACSGEDLVLYNTSWDTTFNPIVSFSIDIGDGSDPIVTDEFDSLVINYADFGEYTITLIVENEEGCTDTMSINAYAEALPEGDVAFDPLVGCGLLDVGISLIDVVAASISIDMGDGSIISIDGDSNYVYTSPGEYEPYVVLMNESGCSIEFAGDSIELFDDPIAGFSISDSSICIGDSITLINLTEDTGYAAIVSYEVDMGDGSSYSFVALDSLGHTYDDPGSYTIEMVIENAGACTDTFTTTIEVHPYPTSVPDLTPLSACGEITIDIPVSSYDADSVVIDFGDGFITYVEADTSYTYTMPGEYIPVFELINTTGCSVSLAPDTIELFDDPIAGFSISDSSICIGDSITLINLTEDTGYAAIVSYEVDMGDGSSYSFVALDSLGHTYDDPGSYTIEMVIENAGACTDTFTTTIEVHPYPTSVPDLSPLSACGEITIDIPVSSYDADSVVINFGDGFVTYVSGDTSYTYSDPGIYIPEFELINFTGCAVSLAPDTIEVFDIPIGDISISDTFVCADDSIIIENNTLDTGYAAIIEYQIEWGDGSTATTSSAEDVANAFTDAGVYEVSVVILNEGGCTDTTWFTIEVQPSPSAEMDISPLVGCDELTSTFSFPLMDADSASLFDGLNSYEVSGTPVSVTYDIQGVYLPVLTVYNDAGCSTEIPGDTLIVAWQPVANLSLPDSVFCTSEPIEILNLSLDPEADPLFNAIDQMTLIAGPDMIFSGDWFDDITHTFTTSGTYDIILITENDNGCIDSSHYTCSRCRDGYIDLPGYLCGA